MIMMLESFSFNPSISTRSWFKVWLCSLVPPKPESSPRRAPRASSSSMKMIHPPSNSERRRAVLNRLRILPAPTPTNISTNSEPDIAIKGILDSVAMALAR